MPVKLERKLQREYKAKGLRGKSLNHAVYGTLAKVEKGKKRGKKKVHRGDRYSV